MPPQIPYVVADPQPVSAPAPAVGSGIGRTLQVVGGQLADAAQMTAGIYDAEQRTKARALASEAALDLQRFAFELDDDPDYDSHEEKWKQKQQEVLQRFRGQIKAPRYQTMFDQDVAPVAQRFALDVAHEVRAKRVDAGRAGVERRLDSEAQLASLATTEAERTFHMERMAGEVTEAVESGLFSAQEGVAIADQGRERVESAELIRMVRTDPRLAYRLLASPTGPYLGKMDEEKRQTWLARAQDAIESDVAAEYTRLQRSIALGKEAERQASRQAETELLTMMEPGDVGYAPVDEIQARLGDMTPEARLRWLKVAKNGGQLEGGSEVNPVIYSDLRRRALEGEPIVDEATDAYLRGELGGSRAAFDALSDLSTATRFKAPAKYIHEVLGARGLMPFTRKDAQREAEAAAVFDGWQRANPEATDEEAWAKAREIVGGQKQPAAALGAHTPPSQPKNLPASKTDAISRALARQGVPSGLSPDEIRAQYPRQLEAALADPQLASDLETVRVYEESEAFK